MYFNQERWDVRCDSFFREVVFKWTELFCRESRSGRLRRRLRYRRQTRPRPQHLPQPQQPLPSKQPQILTKQTQFRFLQVCTKKIHAFTFDWKNKDAQTLKIEPTKISIHNSSLFYLHNLSFDIRRKTPKIRYNPYQEPTKSHHFYVHFPSGSPI